jgi:tRNA G18 (ribose-2'-O)-methylase SpoU
MCFFQIPIYNISIPFSPVDFNLLLQAVSSSRIIGVTMKTIYCTSLDHPDLQPYKTLRRPLDHERQGIFVAEGEKVVRRLLDSCLTINSFLMTPEWFERYRELLDSRAQEAVVFLAEKKLLESIVGFHLHQGIMAVARVPEDTILEEIMNRSSRPWLFVAIEGLTNAENLGVLVRNCAAFGVQALIVGETSSRPYLRRAVRNSMGTVFRIPVVHPPNLMSVLADLHRRYAVQIIGAHPREGSVLISAVNFRHDTCLVFGNEGEGLSREILSVCNSRMVIPMRNGVDSLNVASASAVALYEVQRQRSGVEEPPTES